MSYLLSKPYSWWAVRVIVVMFAICAPLLYLFHAPLMGLAFASISALVLAFAWTRKVITAADSQTLEKSK